MTRWVFGRAMVVASAVMLSAWAPAASAQDRPVYKCPGNVYTNTINAKDAASQGCKPHEVPSGTVIPGPARRPAPAAAESSASRGADTRVDPADQRSRDSDKRMILESELRREEERLVALKQEYNNGQPERRGDEKNYQKYLDRVADLKSRIDRSESDIAALRRELAKAGAN